MRASRKAELGGVGWGEGEGEWGAGSEHGEHGEHGEVVGKEFMWSCEEGVDDGVVELITSCS